MVQCIPPLSWPIQSVHQACWSSLILLEKIMMVQSTYGGTTFLLQLPISTSTLSLWTVLVPVGSVWLDRQMVSSVFGHLQQLKFSPKVWKFGKVGSKLCQTVKKPKCCQRLSSVAKFLLIWSHWVGVTGRIPKQSLSLWQNKDNLDSGHNCFSWVCV